MCTDDNIDCTTMTPHVESLVTHMHAITDEAAYLSEAAKLCLLFLLYSLFLCAIDHIWILL